MADEETKVYALNLFDIADRAEYLAYSRRSAREVARHGGRVLALGRFRESAAGDIAPRQVLILVEWESRAAFESYRQDPALADLHPHVMALPFVLLAIGLAFALAKRRVVRAWDWRDGLPPGLNAAQVVVQVDLRDLWGST